MEPRAVRETGGFIDLTDRGLLSVSGPDAADLLHRVLSNDVRGLAPGAGNRTLLLTNRGRCVADMTLFRTDAGFLLECDREASGPLAKALKKYVLRSRMEISPAGMFRAAFFGNNTDRVQASLGLPPAGEHRIGRVTLPGGVRALYTHIDRFGEVGFELMVGPEAGGEVWRLLSEAGAAAGGERFNMAEMEALRIEAGRPRYGREITGEVFPQEVGLESAVSFSKGCFVGQETVARLRHRGKVNRLLTGFLPSSEVEAGDPVLVRDADGTGHEAGLLTSTAVSPMLGIRVALGFMRTEHRHPGILVDIGHDGCRVVSEVVELPFWKRASEQPS